MHLKYQFFLINKTKFLEMAMTKKRHIAMQSDGQCRAMAKKRHIAMQSTSQMREPSEMFSMQYEKNPLKIVGGDPKKKS